MAMNLSNTSNLEHLALKGLNYRPRMDGRPRMGVTENDCETQVVNRMQCATVVFAVGVTFISVTSVSLMMVPVCT